MRGAGRRRIGARGFFAQGYSGHGVALACLSGALMAETIAGDPARLDLLAKLDIPRFPGGTLLRDPLRVLAMLYGMLRDAA